MDPGGASTRLVGFRAWTLKEGGLRSIYKSWDWPLLGDARAHCLCNNPHQQGLRMEPIGPTHLRAPDPEDGACGLYAYDRLVTAELYIEEQNLKGPPILGVVLLWGEIRVGPVKDLRRRLTDPGYRLRAEFARVVAIDNQHPGAESIKSTGQIARIPRRYLQAWAVEVYGATRYQLEQFK